MKDTLLTPRYDHNDVEANTYDNWYKAKYFEAKDCSKTPCCMVIPPPNVTGKLHLGHAWDTTIQDIIARYKRLKGFDMLWLPGMDHAGIATQAKVEERLKQQGISRYDIGREQFLEHSWAWKDEYAKEIRKQWAKMGLSLDYSRERFTMDEGLSKAVHKVFVDLYNDGLIYQGERIINWDPHAKTALSNIEVIHQEIEGAMYYFKYRIVENDEDLIIATTRPETMFADQAIFVHPDDKRYTHLVGMYAINPANNEQLIIMADDYIDLSFGTAVMKCTPAHDPNDFALAKKYDLAMPICMNPDGTMNELCGKYEGMDRFECRTALVKDFERTNVVDHIEKHVHQVGHSQRSGVIVEPYLSKQWFVKMKPLAKKVLENQLIEDQKINFTPKRFEKTFNQWLENIEDWCISRQLWWGHRIPAWFHNDSGDIYVGEFAPEDIENYHQDEDVLDTWFSSALWPFSTLGWPEKSADFDRYFPNDVLATGYDIIFFWVARMAFQARYCLDSRPFKDVVIHGLVRDEQGRKMSKSLGNGIDPMDIIDKYGVDALRFFLTTNSTPGQDLRFDEKKVESSANFINKIWNAARYIQMQLPEGYVVKQVDIDKISNYDEWILARFYEVLEEVEMNMEKYEYALVGNALYSFVYNDFCSWYIELSKGGLQSGDQSRVEATLDNLLFVITQIIKMLSPFMPFVCEKIYLALPHEKASLQLETWPIMNKSFKQFKGMEDINQLIAVIENVRSLKVEYQMKPKEELQICLLDENDVAINKSDNWKTVLASMCHASIDNDIKNEDDVVRVIPNGSMRVNLSTLVNVEEEIAKIKKACDHVESEIIRGENMLKNQNFINKAPAKKINEEEEKVKNYEAQLKILKSQLAQLTK